MCSQGCLVVKANEAKKDGRYHIVQLSLIKKTEPFLRVITPLTQAGKKKFPLKKTAAQLGKDYLTNIKQIH